ncbi:MAG: 50S ribosomal protein L21 [Candidatus Amesbacteria bacterium GW2011_GWB1_47_19]|nr:MAG: 50S ribosomal protein L21 [Candidatus Amesbacteria bacterium GW2011_GWA1_44_24]KKU30938.1 MAG: ribosomal protein L21, large subunit ribosomal protein L21 [Candidatus Amesbacteria bacterium GW2011_GWC1_46_24]KKU66601.1 MAG: 50S ribosomal protein L21 [Candidatus Amesbacteria bacterium GW2011_GWB1_47_19]OGD05321.1 MAG: 50S ribosomal protein L21 [Candidatus Amesbacteria bacterium RIFOXYB1_FULL_47_13]HBC73224.1 50S ribosomal protein L21 [Candidatus Amesbacteria bacterium]
MQAIIKIGSSQFLVTPGQEILVSLLPDKPESSLTIKEILVIISDHQTRVGNPYLADVKVLASVIKHEPGQKIRISTYKAKSRYRKTRGFRPRYTRLRIDDIKEAKSVKRA